MTIELGRPTWTTGGFTRVAAQDDLGLESVGAALLRRLLPGIVETTTQVGYYGFYPYLLAAWQERSDSVLRSDFRPWYRRQEVAFAAACILHEHAMSATSTASTVQPPSHGCWPKHPRTTNPSLWPSWPNPTDTCRPRSVATDSSTVGCWPTCASPNSGSRPTSTGSPTSARASPRRSDRCSSPPTAPTVALVT